MEIFEKKLEFLLINKAFSNLSEDEKCYVLRYLTEDEYTRASLLLNRTIEAFATADAGIEPDYTIEHNLKEAFRAKFKPKHHNLFLPLIRFKFPEPYLVPILLLIAIFSGIGILIFSSPPKSIAYKEAKPVIISPDSIATNKILEIPFEDDRKGKVIKAPQLKNRINREKKDLDTPLYETPLCLNIQIDPLGINLDIKDYIQPGLLASLSFADSLSTEIP